STPTPVPTNPNNVVLKAVAYDDMSNIKNNGDTIICYNNSWIEFKNVDFNKWPIFPTDSISNLSVSALIKNVPKDSFSYIEVRLDDPSSGTLISAFKADSFQCPQDKLTAFYNSNEGKIYTSAHNVYVVFKSSSNEVCELDRISINFGVSSQHAPTPTPRLYTATPTPTYYNATPTIKPDNILELQTENYDEMSGVVNNGTSITCSDKSWIKFKNIDFSKLKKYAGDNYSNPLQIKAYGKVNYSNPFETLEVRLDSLYGPVIGKEMLSGWYTKYGTGLVIDGYLEYSLNIDNQYVDDLLANPHDIYIVYDAFNSQSLRTFDKLVFSY
ncbi:MAG: hypothetical protein Q8942_20860, partial [Bacillota bacterium]|nr:hypothetical protein [Bacillota bacterium]